MYQAVIALKSSLATLVTPLIMNVDYCNVALAGLLQCDLD